LVAVLAQPFRSGAAETVTDGGTAARAPTAGLAPEWRHALLTAGIAVALTAVALWPTLQHLASIWSSGESYQFAWLVLPVFCYLVGWQQRDRVLAMAPQPGYAGAAVILAGLLGWLTAATMEFELGQHVALVLVLQGIALATLGWPNYRRLFPIFALLFFLVPAGDALLAGLRLLTLKWIEWFGLAGGLPMRIEGFAIYLGEFRYIVAETCAGLGIFNLASFMGYCFGLMLFRSLPRILLLAATAGALAIASNAVRVCLIVAMDWVRGEQMDLAAHGDIQLLLFLLLLTALLLLVMQLSPEQRDSGSVAGADCALATEMDGPYCAEAPNMERTRP
jgi:exosortase